MEMPKPNSKLVSIRLPNQVIDFIRIIRNRGPGAKDSETGASWEAIWSASLLLYQHVAKDEINGKRLLFKPPNFASNESLPFASPLFSKTITTTEQLKVLGKPILGSGSKRFGRETQCPQDELNKAKSLLEKTPGYQRSDEDSCKQLNNIKQAALVMLFNYFILKEKTGNDLFSSAGDNVSTLLNLALPRLADLKIDDLTARVSSRKKKKVNSTKYTKIRLNTQQSKLGNNMDLSDWARYFKYK
jgi:hypothetical protein